MSRGGRGSRVEIKNILKTLRILADSAVGYNVRQLQEPLQQQALRTVLGAGNVVRPFDENRHDGGADGRPSRSASPFPNLPTDVIDRAKVVAAGVQTFVNLAAQGKFPGSGGYVVDNERIARRSNEAVDRSPRVYDTTGTPSPITGGLDLKHHPEEEQATSGSTTRRDTVVGQRVERGVDPLMDRTSAILGSTPSSETEQHISKPMFSEGISPQEEAFLINAAKEVGVVFPTAGVAKQQLPKTTTKVERKAIVQEEHIYKPSLPKNYRVQLQEDSMKTLEDSRARKVPASRISRLANFGMLAVGLGTGAAAEVTRRSLGLTQSDTSTADRVVGSSNPFLTPANAERIVQTLCRVRDESTVPSYLLQIFERVRHSADFMPTHQVHKQMAHELGDNWRDHFKEFEDKPFAAASIGQVHRGVTLDGRKVAVKVQYPGVAEGIDSDIDNLVSVLNISGLFPKGMFLENFVPVARRELKMECDYRREARAMLKFRDLLANDNAFYVPGVFTSLSSKRVLTAEYIEGKSVDLCVSEPQEVRDYVAAKFIELCLREIFVWRFMQTDPNWSNFFLGEHPMTGEPRLILLDFGASRTYPKKFVDRYMKIIRSAYDLDTEGILKHSKEIGFLTGYESKAMQKAHCDSIMILAETLASDHPYDFGEQNITRRIHELIPVMLEHRLTAPPEEIYSLHRKLSGSYLLATKLKAVVSCGPLFHEISHRYKFGEDGRDINIETDTNATDEASDNEISAKA